VSAEVPAGAVVVAGSINMDLVVTAERHPKVGETVPGGDLHFLPGGKGANQALAAARLGARARLVGKLGRDAFGDRLHAFFVEGGLDLSFTTRTSEAGTGTALIVVAGADNSIVVVPGANGLLAPADVEGVPIARGDVLVSQFEIPEATILAFFARGKRSGAKTVLNPAPARRCAPELRALADVLVVNETELAFFLESDIAKRDVISAARGLPPRPEQIVVVTLGAGGAVAVDGEREVIAPGRTVPVVDTTGAGDCFVGALAARLAAGDDLERALHYANAAASLSVQRLGAASSMPTSDEVARQL
jgi:ribokinase